MARLEGQSKLIVEATLTLTEAEVLALSEVSAYNHDTVVSALAKSTNNSIGSRHAPALLSFLGTVRSFAPKFLQDVARARKVLQGEATNAPQEADPAPS